MIITLHKQQLLRALVLGLILVACGMNEDPKVNCSNSNLTLELDSMKWASSCQSADGVIGVVAFGGRSPYIYSIDGTDFGYSPLFNAVKTGIYSVVVKDSDSCSVTLDNVYVQADGFLVVPTVAPDNLCLDGDGSILIEVEGGVEPYSYRLGEGEFTSSNLFQNLDQGSHMITVLDDDGCSVDLNITVPQGDTDVTWSGEILPIIEANCAISGCHNGVSRPDLRLYNRAALYAKDIKYLTETGLMPFDDQEELTEAEIKIIGCWVNDGAPNN